MSLFLRQDVATCTHIAHITSNSNTKKYFTHVCNVPKVFRVKRNDYNNI